jgi:hypothetical protein
MVRLSRAILLLGGVACFIAGTVVCAAAAQEHSATYGTSSATQSGGRVTGIPPFEVVRSCQTDDGSKGYVAFESMFGKSDPGAWRPLRLSTLFSEGWDEVWVPSPSGSGGAPRGGWINAAFATLPRVHFFTFAQGFNNLPEGNAYQGAYTLATPFNRRFGLTTNVPFVLRNSVDSGLPVIDPPEPAGARTRSHTGFGDVSFTPRILLHESQDLSLTAELAVSTPTGSQPIAGNRTSLTPNISFWNNIAGRAAIRGGAAVRFPTDGSGSEFIGQLAVGHTLTDHDVPVIGDFTSYLAAVVNAPLSDSDRTWVALTPGIRAHVGNDWYFLAGLPTPVTRERIADLGMVFWLMKAW